MARERPPAARLGGGFLLAANLEVFGEIDGAALVLVLGPAFAPVLTLTGSMPVPTTVRVLAGGIRADDPRSRLV